MEEDPSKPQKYHYVYEITNIYNGMRYFGARSCICLPRDDTKYMGSSRHLKKAIKAEGLSHFSKLILAVFPTREKALEYEIFLHNRFNVNRDPMFYNKAKQTSTGFDFQASGPDHPCYGRKLTEEQKTVLRQANLGKPSHLKGKHPTEEAKEKNRQAHLGKKLSEEHKKKIGDSERGKTMSDEARKNRRIAMAGENNPRFGIKVSQDTRNKQSISGKNRVTYIYVTPKGEFKTSEEAAKILDCSKHAILDRCKKEFEGYSLKPIENKYKKKREELAKLLEQGYSIPEIEKIMKVHNATLLRWKHEKEGTSPNGFGTKLNTTKVLEIRYLYDIGVPTNILEKEFDLVRSQIHRIGKRQNWSHIPEELSPIDTDWQKNYCM
jgi:group I intron endonuclease